MLPLSLNCPEYWQGFTHGVLAYTAVLIVVWAFCGWLTLFSGSHKPDLMPTPEQLSAEKRKRVAEECIPVASYVAKYFAAPFVWKIDDNIEEYCVAMYSSDFGGGACVDCWNPKENLKQKDALVSKVAQMIEELPEDEYSDLIRKRELRRRHSQALATNNTPQIEALAYELIEGGKDD